MEFRVLGPVEVVEGGTALRLGGPRHRRLLAVLLLHAGEVLTTDRLIGMLWGDDAPASPTDRLYVRISELRGLLRAGRPSGGPELLHTRTGGYQLALTPTDELDTTRFERMAAAGRRALAGGDPEIAVDRLAAALALWRGEPFADLGDRRFAEPEIVRLGELRLQALEDRVEAELAMGGHAEVAGELEALAAEHPLRERFWCQLMLAHYRAGRQGEALRAYGAAREVLVGELGIEPGPELQRLHVAILRQDPTLLGEARPAGPRALPAPSNLPAPLTRLIGRDAELAAAGKLLDANPLVTLTGPGGAGKSRLALEVAGRRLADHPDGVWLVELASLTGPDLVVRAVASVVGVRERPGRPLVEVLADELRPARALLVLDNCEHLLAEAAGLARRLLAACPELRVVATSRQRLGITGEVVLQVGGLGLADPDGSPELIGRAAAVRLFVERATAVQPGFELGEATAATVARVCRRLDGLPLAIELAAARLSALGVGQVADRLDDRFALLARGEPAAVPRHQTLRSVVAWSCALLEEPEQRLFDRLAVFAGGFGLEAAEAVCADTGGGEAAAAEVGGDPVVELLSRLVDRSLVAVEANGGLAHRYRLLDTVRAYALEGLERRGEVTPLRARHAAFYLDLAETARDRVRGPEQAAWLERLETEHGNLRVALGWSAAAGEPETAVRLASSLYRFWDLRGHYSEGRQWLVRALELPGAVAPPARARALVDLAQLEVLVGGVERGVAACTEAVALCRQAGDTEGLARALQFLGFAATYADDLDQALVLLEESLRLSRAAGVPYLEGWSLLILALVATAREAYDRAAALAGECEAVLRRVGDVEGVAWSLLIRAAAALWRGRPGAAAAPLRAGLRSFQDLGASWGLSLGVVVAPRLALQARDWRRTAILLGAAEALRAATGATMIPFVDAWRAAAGGEATAALGAAAFQRRWREGLALRPKEAVAEAMLTVDAAERSAAVPAAVPATAADGGR